MNLYQVLGVSPQASAAELKAAYRKLARELHPDQNQGDQAKEERFKRVAYAYSVLADPEKRARYERIKSTAAIPLAGARNFVAKAAADVLERAAAEASKYAATQLGKGGALGKKAATGADILLEVGKEWGQERLARFVKGIP